MNRFCFVVALFAAVVLVGLNVTPESNSRANSSTTVSATANPADQTIRFNQQIRPILSQHCIACHGPDEGERKAGLRVDIRDEALDVIEPGDADNSELFERISTDDEDDRMPPTEHGNALTGEQIELIRQWIDEGANYETHWSFVAPEKPAVPETAHGDWARNEIDHFVAARLDELELTPSPDGDPHRLIRRVALDLTGLPPPPEMVQRFADNPTDEIYESIVDELLASPDFGEHWAAMWLDIARYADTMGYAEDRPRSIWPWRDWVIRAFNENMPYDRFTIEQIAGDLLPGATDEQKLATAFHRNTLNNTEGGTNDEEFRTIAVKDRISTTVNVWAGLTMRCAECHTHKYDPISQTEYYQFLDFFNQTVDADTGDEAPLLDVFPSGREAEFAMLDAQIESTRKEIELLRVEAEKEKADRDAEDAPSPQPSPPDDEQDEAREVNEQDEAREGEGAEAADAEVEDAEIDDAKEAAPTPKQDQLVALEKRLEELLAQRGAPVRVPVMADLPDDKQRETFVNVRGNFMSPGDQVHAAVPAAFNSLPDDAPRNRLAVAHWLIADENPLTARVTVNRFWARLFGRGIVETEEDFGTQGSMPANQPLLDWLAVDFRENGWDVKRLLKQIVMSSTFRQDNRATEDQLLKDPRNLYLAHGPRFRLSAEVVRDQALAVSGLLSKKQFGPPVYPPNPVKIVRNAFTGGETWTVSEGEDRYRRAVYTYLKRSSPHPLFETFDMASRVVCNMRRIRTNTPLQSFMTLNDETFVEAARSLAEMMQEKESVDEQIRAGLKTALLHPAGEDRTQVLAELYASSLEDYQSDYESAAKLAGVDLVEDADDATKEKTARLAALTVVANVIMNLDEFLTR